MTNTQRFMTALVQLSDGNQDTFTSIDVVRAAGLPEIPANYDEIPRQLNQEGWFSDLVVPPTNGRDVWSGLRPRHID
jgi:hypothetical protein